MAQLPGTGDVPALLTRINSLAAANQLGWTAADYHLSPATDSKPASLEVMTNFKAPYPQLRSFIGQVLREVPASTLRELELNRVSSETIDVDVKMTIAILLKDVP